MLALLPLVGYLALFRAIWRRGGEADPRPALLNAAILWGVLVAVGCEGLSLFGGLTPTTLALSWVAAIGITIGLDLSLKVPPFPWRRLAWRTGRFERFLAAPIVVIVALTGLIAAVAWPNE